MCHTAEATLDALSPVFDDRIISRSLATSKLRFDTVGLLFVLHTIDNVVKNWTDRVTEIIFHY